MIRALSLLFLPLGILTYSAEQAPVRGNKTFKFICRQTFDPTPTSRLPVEKYFTYSFDFSNSPGSVSLPDFEPLFSLAAESKVDYSSCFTSNLDSFINELHWACADARGSQSGEGECSMESMAKIVAPLKLRVEALNAKMAKEPRIPPVVPFDPAFHDPSERESPFRFSNPLSLEYMDDAESKFQKNSFYRRDSITSFLEEIYIPPHCREPHPAKSCLRLIAGIRKSIELLKRYPLRENNEYNRKQNAFVNRISGCGDSQMFSVIGTVMTDLERYREIGKKEDTEEREKNRCRKLAIGETREFTPEDSPIDMHTHFSLKRTSEKEYTAEIPLLIGSPSKLSEDPSFQEKTRNKIQECLTPIQDKLIGAGGEKLKIQIVASNEQEQAQKVAVKEGHFRENSGELSADSPCSTIIHESMHWLGLVDEYKEKWIGYSVDPTTGATKLVDKGAENPIYDCRALGPDDSVMSDQVAALSATLDEQFEEIACTCDPYAGEVRMECIADLSKHVKGSGCPGKSVKFTQRYPRKARVATWPAGDAAYGFESGNTLILSRAIIPPRASLLYPAQFQAILEPSCADRNQTYFKCASQAYKSSKAVSPDGPGCADDLPPACKKGGAEWLAL